MKEFFDHFAAVVAAATLALLLFAVCHEYGYFWVIGSHFQTFVSTTDYFTNSTQWIVFALLVLYNWVDLKAMLGGEYAAPIGRNWRTWLFPLFIVVPILFVQFTNAYAYDVGWIFVVAYFWLVYGARRVPFADSTDPVLVKVRMAIVAAPIIAIAAFVSGKQRADSALASMSDPYKLKLKGGEERNRILLRSFDKGLLVRSPADERVEFIKWDQIEEVTKSSPRDRGESYACIWFGWMCRKDSITP